jgi:ABC-type phosphate/phosphonate transport system permease subunit
MAKKTETKSHGLTLPIAAMLLMAALGAIVVSGSFEIIKYWPLPQSVEPYYDWKAGAVWGGVAGAFFGFVLGFLTDDNHFKRPEVSDAGK